MEPRPTSLQYSWSISSMLEVAAFALFALDGFKQRLKVSFAETAAPFALNDFEEERRTIFDRPSENLQHVALVIPIDENAKFLQLVDRLINDADALLQFGVVRVGNMQEIDSLGVKTFRRVPNVIRCQRDVLDSGAGIKIEIFLDLRFAFPLGRLVDRELHIAIA